jgi:hypothetical protein
MIKTYEGLYQQVDELIDKKIARYLGGAQPGTMQSAVGVVPYSDRKLNEITNELSKLFATQAEINELSGKIDDLAQSLAYMVDEEIVSGLAVTANDPPDMKVNVSAGYGGKRGRPCELESAKEVTIPTEEGTSIFYVTLQSYGQVNVRYSKMDDELTLAKIVIPKPNVTAAIVDDKPDDGYDGYIISAKDMYFDEDQEFDDASIAVLREHIGKILADNIIGSIKLNENLKIINTHGTLEMNSKELLIKDEDANILSRFDRDGIYFFDRSGYERAHFSRDDARIGNIIIDTNSIQSGNFVAGTSGFKIEDNGDVEFDDATIRGTIHASGGTIGGFTITSARLYGGIIQTGENVGAGQNGVKMDENGLHVYDDILGRVVHLPSDGSAPSFASGTITETTFEISTNAILRTSSTVGDGSASSYGVLINNTGLYGCEANQTLADANLKALTDGTVRLKGEIEATSGHIGNVTITSTKLTGGLIEGTNIVSPIIETSSTTPRIRMDADGLTYQETTLTGKYGQFKYGDGTKYGVGVIGYLFNTSYPPLAILAEQATKGDIRLYNRSDDPASGTQAVGDLIVVSGALKICDTAGTPGTFTAFAKTTATWNKIIDADSDTQIQVEESADEDIVRIDTAGTQRAQIDINGLKLTSGADITEFSTDGTLADNSDDAVPTEKAAKTYIDARGFADRGDPSSLDKTTWTADGNWYDWDLSAVVPAGAKAVLLWILVSDDAANSTFKLRKNGNSNAVNFAEIYTQVSGVFNTGDFIVACDSNRVIEYNATNTTWTDIQAVIKGWFL